jgi:hypothetical protein
MDRHTSSRRGDFSIAAALAMTLILSLLSATAAHTQFALETPDNLNSSETIEVLNSLQALYPEAMGFRVGAPFEPEEGTGEDFARLLKAFRVIVIPPEVTVNEAARRLAQKGSPFKQLLDHGEKGEFLPEAPVGYSGVLATARLNKKLVDLQFITVNMNRWLIWAKDNYFPMWQGERDTPLQEYAAAVSQYMRRNDFGSIMAEEPVATDVGAPAKADLYGPRAPEAADAAGLSSVMSAHKEMKLDFAKGAISFVAGPGAIKWMVKHSGNNRFSDTDQARLQRVFQTFIEESRSFKELMTLSPEVLADLSPGRYFYAVDEYGRVRFGPIKCDGQDPMSLWTERAKSYECLLFPGQPVVAAGEFEVAQDQAPAEASLDGASSPRGRIAAVNAFSCYYFYPPGDKDLKNLAKKKSDKFLVSAGHFLGALEDMGIEPDGVRISKF